MKINNLLERKSFLILLCPIMLLVVINLIVLITHTSLDKKTGSTTKSQESSSKYQLSIKSHTATYSLPQPPLSCQTNASLVDLSSDYVISGMNCYSTNNKSNSYISCDGTDFNDVINFNCYQPPKFSFSSELICRGSVTSTYGVMPIQINYHCSRPELNSPELYDCNGSINVTSLSSVSVPLDINCR